MENLTPSISYLSDPKPTQIDQKLILANIAHGNTSLSLALSVSIACDPMHLMLGVQLSTLCCMFLFRIWSWLMIHWLLQHLWKSLVLMIQKLVMNAAVLTWNLRCVCQGRHFIWTLGTGQSMTRGTCTQYTAKRYVRVGAGLQAGVSQPLLQGRKILNIIK